MKRTKHIGNNWLQIKTFTFMIVAPVLLFQCREKPEAMAPEVVKTQNPSVLKAQVSTKDTATLYLKLRHLKSGQVSYSQTSYGLDHSIELPALQPSSQYELTWYSDGAAVTKPDTIETPEISKSIVRSIPLKTTKQNLNGYLLTQRRLARGNLYMLDEEARVVWSQEIEGVPKLSRYTAEGNLLVLVGNNDHKNSAGDHILGITFAGDTLYHIDLSSLEKPLVAHHEIQEYKKDVMLLVDDTRPFLIDGDSLQVKSSALVQLSKAGEEIWRWSMFDVKNPVEDLFISDHLEDWGHANAFSFDTDGNILLSCRDWNQIWKIDIETGELIWTLGENGTLTMEGIPFSGQHAIHINKDGHYMLFDNGREVRKSRVLSYDIKEANARSVLDIDLADDFYADRMGNAQLLPNGNVLVCSPKSSSVLIFSVEGKLLYQARIGLPDPYRATYVPSFYSDKPPK